MIYIRRIFTQDLRDGKQIAFTTEPSNYFFNFNFKTPDPNREISFEYKEKKEVQEEIKTRLYAAGSESRIDGELKAYLISELKVEVNDIIIFKKNSRSSNKYSFEVVFQSDSTYDFYNTLLGPSNHEVVLVDTREEEENRNVLSDFAKWLNNSPKNSYFENDYDQTLKELKNIADKYEETFSYNIFDIPSKENFIEYRSTILKNIKKTDTPFFEYSEKKSRHMPRAILGDFNYLKFLDEYYNSKRNSLIINTINQIDFELDKLISDLEKAYLHFKPKLVTRFVSSLITKPFVLLNGLSGSGKTKLAQAFVQWICQEERQYKIIPVGADWTNREPLLGYPDGLNSTMYVTPDNGALQVMLDAKNNPNLPFFLILDEMNLSHVERYFADFLSIMESKDSIKLYTGEGRVDTLGTSIPQTLVWPENLFIIGTVNIDETTYMFSPKVLDRANVIEFRLSENELEQFFSLTDGVDLKELVSGGATMSNAFLELAKSELKANDKAVQDELVEFFKALSNVGAEFGYRTANEVLQLVNQLGTLDASMHINDKIDIAVMQKLLPKLNGSRSKIVKVLETLAALCLIDAKDFDLTKGEKNLDNIKYPISYGKLMRMYHNVIANGFTSYAEA